LHLLQILQCLPFHCLLIRFYPIPSCSSPHAQNCAL
jgi:hypothetical protein